MDRESCLLETTITFFFHPQLFLSVCLFVCLSICFCFRLFISQAFVAFNGITQLNNDWCRRAKNREELCRMDEIHLKASCSVETYWTVVQFLLSTEVIRYGSLIKQWTKSVSRFTIIFYFNSVKKFNWSHSKAFDFISKRFECWGKLKGRKPFKASTTSSWKGLYCQDCRKILSSSVALAFATGVRPEIKSIAKAHNYFKAHIIPKASTFITSLKPSTEVWFRSLISKQISSIRERIKIHYVHFRMFALSIFNCLLRSLVWLNFEYLVSLIIK